MRTYNISITYENYFFLIPSKNVMSKKDCFMAIQKEFYEYSWISVMGLTF